MANPFIATPYWSDLGTITTGNEIATMPASNLQNQQPSVRWRSSGLSNLWVRDDLGTARAVTVVALCSHNATAAATWQVRASTDSSPETSPDYNSGSLNMFPGGVKPSDVPLRTHFDTFLLLSSAQTWRNWRVDVTDAANPSGYFEAGRIVIGSALSLVIEYGFSRAYDVADIATRTAMGGFVGEARGRPRVVTMPLEIGTEAEEMALYALQHLRGTAQDVFACENPDATTYLHHSTILGTMTVTPPFVREGVQLRRGSIEIREAL